MTIHCGLGVEGLMDSRTYKIKHLSKPCVKRQTWRVGRKLSKDFFKHNFTLIVEEAQVQDRREKYPEKILAYFNIIYLFFLLN